MARRQSPGNFFVDEPEEAKKPDGNLIYTESVLLNGRP
jgi:hypothetical protein